MARHTINVVSAVNYIRSLRSSALDGLYYACKDKMDELGVAQNKGCSNSMPHDPNGPTPTGNLASIIEFCTCCCEPHINKNVHTKHQRKAMADAFEADKKALCCIFDAVRTMMRRDKHDPQRTMTQEGVDASLGAESRAAKRASRAAEKKHADDEVAKAEAAGKADEERAKRAEAQAQAEADADAAAAELNKKVRDKELEAKRKRDDKRNKNRKVITPARDADEHAERTRKKLKQ